MHTLQIHNIISNIQTNTNRRTSRN